jgi:thioredoxin 1
MSENIKYQIFKTISPLDALKLIKKHQTDQDLIILDVRTPWEFSDDHIEGAINLDYTDPDFNEMIKKLDKGKYYLIYCKSGRRSINVCEILKELGFTHVYNIKDGFKGWKSEIV